MSYNKNERTLLKSGTLWGLYTGLTAAFVTAYALALGAPNTVIGILGALPWIANMLSQIPGAQILEYFSRKKVYVASTTISRLSWLLIILIPYFFMHNTFFYLVIFVFLMKFTDFSADPAWISLFADVVRKKHRARFTADRRILIGIAHMVITVIAGMYLDLFPENNFAGFSTVFFVGLIFGLATTVVTSRIKEPEYIDHRHHPVKEFFTLRGAFMKFCMFILYFHFATHLASPFFAVYLLKNLDFSYTFFMATVGITSLSKLISHYHFGKILDRFGEKNVLFFGVMGVSLVPLIYLFINDSTKWLVIPTHIISGFAWAGTDQSIFQMLLDYTDKEQRALQVAEYSIISSFPIVIAPILGGVIADNVNWLLAGIPLVFAISFCLRLSAILFVMRLKEPRDGKHYSAFYVFRRVVGLRPIEGISHVVHVVKKGVFNR